MGVCEMGCGVDGEMVGLVVVVEVGKSATSSARWAVRELMRASRWAIWSWGVRLGDIVCSSVSTVLVSGEVRSCSAESVFMRSRLIGGAC